MASALDNGEVTVEEALSANSFENKVQIDQMAALLVPRGVEPARVAGMASSGAWCGEESAHYEALAEQFAGYAESDDSSVAAVGVAGVEIFSLARDEARERERQGRIRGDIF